MKKGILYLFIVAALFAACTRIKPTEAGFKVSNSGSYRGVDSLPLLTGWQFYLPWATRVVTIPTTQQHIVWTADKTEGSDGNEEFHIAALGGSGFSVDLGINYTVDANRASKIYLKWGTDNLATISSTFLKNAARAALQDVSSTITMDSVLNGLTSFESAAAQKFKTKVEPYGFTIDLFNIMSKPRPDDPQIAQSINNKIKAKQDAETSIMQLQITNANANKQVAEARGDSAAKVIRAAGEAEEMRRKQAVLTPQYVEFTKWSKWDGVLPSTITGGATMLNLKP